MCQVFFRTSVSCYGKEISPEFPAQVFTVLTALFLNVCSSDLQEKFWKVFRNWCSLLAGGWGLLLFICCNYCDSHAVQTLECVLSLCTNSGFTSDSEFWPTLPKCHCTLFSWFGLICSFEACRHLKMGSRKRNPCIAFSFFISFVLYF